SINMKSLVVGEQPPGYDVGDAYHHILMSILMAARAHDKQAIDGPFLQIRDVEAFQKVAGRSAALGFDGKWVLHPGQIDAANETALEHEDAYPQDIVDGMKEMGLFGLTIPEEYGGLGESLLTYALVVEQIARGWMSVSGVINTHFIVAYMLMHHGTEEQKQRY